MARTGYHPVGAETVLVGAAAGAFFWTLPDGTVWALVQSFDSQRHSISDSLGTTMTWPAGCWPAGIFDKIMGTGVRTNVYMDVRKV